MAEYITKEEACKESFIVQTKEYGSIEVVPVDYIASIEAADVQPKKFGHWIGNPYMLNRQKCSECGFWQDDLHIDNFCPSCGVDMRGNI